jgi:hypothetical protein
MLRRGENEANENVDHVQELPTNLKRKISLDAIKA